MFNQYSSDIGGFAARITRLTGYHNGGNCRPCGRREIETFDDGIPAEAYPICLDPGLPLSPHYPVRPAQR